MTFPNMSEMPVYEPRWLGVRELNLGDQWRARWVAEEELPAGVLVDHVYAVVLLDRKGYLCRARGEAVWDTLEGSPTPGSKPEAYLKAIAKERIGADAARLDLIGYLDCRATSHNASHAAGTAAIRPIYAFAAKKVADGPKAAGFERRRYPLNEYNQELRVRYPEFHEYFALAVERYLVLQARGEVS